MKKIITLLALFCMLFAINTTVFATETTSDAAYYNWDSEKSYTFCNFYNVNDEKYYGKKIFKDYAYHSEDDVRKKAIYIEDINSYLLIAEFDTVFYCSMFETESEESVENRAFSPRMNSEVGLVDKISYYKTDDNGARINNEIIPPYAVAYTQIDMSSYVIEANYSHADYATMGEFVADLRNYETLTDYFNGKFPEEEEPEIKDGYLPPLNYKFSSKTAWGFPNITQAKDTVKWNYTEESIYRQNPGAYAVEMLVSGHFKESVPGSPVNTKIIDTSNTTINNDCKFYLDSNIFISKNEYSFRVEDAGKKLYKMAGAQAFDEAVESFFLYIRTKEIAGSKVSYWKCYKVYFNGAVERVDISYDKDGKPADLPDEEKDPEGPGIDYEYDGHTDDSSTDADHSPSSDLYEDTDDVSAKNVLNNLKSIVNTLGGITEIVSKVAGWIPSDIVTLIGVGIGFIVVVGIVKWLL